MGNDSSERFEEREERACREAVLHVAEGWVGWAEQAGGPGRAEDPATAGAFTVLAPAAPSVSYAAFVHAAERLCTLESLAHRTAEVDEDLRMARADFDASAPAVVATLPARFPGSSLRTFAGLAASQREWIEETGWLDVDAASRASWIAESPSRSWSCFGPGNAVVR